MRKLFTLFFALVASAGTLFAWDFEHVQINDLYYNLDSANKVAELTGEITSYPYENNYAGLTIANIPSAVLYNAEEYSVTSIGGSAFSGCSSLTSVTIPEGVTSIGNTIFDGCIGLKYLELPSTLNMDTYFWNKLTSDSAATGIRLDTLKLASGMLSSLERCEVMGGNYCEDARYTIAGDMLYQSYQNRYYHYDNGNFAVCRNIKYVEAPSWFFDVPEEYWFKCPKTIEKIVINRGVLNQNVLGVLARQTNSLTIDISAVTNLPDKSFVDFYKLQSITLPDNIDRIGYKTFAECVKLQSIDIPASVVEIDDRAFEDCRSLQTITFGGKQPAAVSGKSFARAAETSNLKRIGNWAFYNAHELQHLEIPESVEEIGDAAFYGCVYLEDLVLPSSVQSIGDNCFALCSKLNKIVVSATTPPTIQAKTFYDVKRQIPVYVPDESVDEYEGDTYWQEFNIQGISNMPQGLEDVSSSLQGGDRGRLIYHEGQIYILRGEHIFDTQGKMVK